MSSSVLDSSSDENLMAELKKGNEKAFELLYLRHKRGIYSYVVRYTGSQEEAEEIFHEVFIKLHRAAGHYEPTAKFSTWLFTIVKNLCIDQHRKKRFRQTISLDEPVEEGRLSLHEVIATHQPSPEVENLDQQLNTILENGLKEINPDQREIFLMREKIGLKFEEIAEMLKISVNTAKSRMRYAMEALQKYLKKSGYQELIPEEYRSRKINL